MDTFEIIVLSIAVILLIAALGAFVYFMTKVAKTSEWPPVVSECPDFWETYVWENTEGQKRYVCKDTAGLIDEKCKTFYNKTDGTTDSELMQGGEYEGTTINKYLAWSTGSDDTEDWQYSGYNTNGTHTYSDGFKAYYGTTYDQSAVNDGTAGWSSNFAADPQQIGNDSTNGRNYRIQDGGTSVAVSFNLEDTDSMTKNELDSEKAKWANMCGVTWDGIA